MSVFGAETLLGSLIADGDVDFALDQHEVGNLVVLAAAFPLFLEGDIAKGGMHSILLRSAECQEYRAGVTVWQ